MASVDARKVIRYVYPDKCGVHRCATFGDFRDRPKDLAAFIGSAAIEAESELGPGWVQKDSTRRSLR